MKIVRRNSRAADPAVSFVLLDWGCRERFPTPEYLSNQITPRDQYEVIWVEYYDRQPSELVELVDRYERHGLPAPIDTWIILARPKGEMFRKHVMNNIGFLHSRGRIVVFMDSDAITGTSIVDTIIKEFQDDPDVILYLEEIRTGDKSFYPFGYPNAKEIIPVAANLANGVPLGMRNHRCGLLADPSLIHCRNYGACFAARREDIIRVGGWDECDDYTGYIAGPYEMSMRMEWTGKRERWSFRELLWHVPHPGNDGIDNFSGPHDGKGVSTTAMKILQTRRTLPLAENPDIRRLREAQFGPEPPPALASRPEPPPAAEPTPTTPEKARQPFLPAQPASSWNKETFHLLARLLQDLECRLHGHEYPRAFVVGGYAACLAKQLNLPQDRVEAIYMAGVFGSVENLVRLADAPGRDNGRPAFFTVALTGLLGQEPLLTAAQVSLMRRERYDGAGPGKVRGDAIPLEARIVALAERLDELVHLRGPTGSVLLHQAYPAILAESGKSLDPHVVDAFKQCLEDLVCVHLKAQHDALPFLYPCSRYAPSDGPGEWMCGEFCILPVKRGQLTRYFAVPSWEPSSGLVFSSYDLNEVTGYATQRMAVAGFHGYNLIACANRFFAIEQGEPELRLARYFAGDYGDRCHMASDLWGLKKKVFRARLRRKLRNAVLKPAKGLARMLVK